jgi:putative oxidoreductase
MTDSIATAPGAADKAAGEVAVSRLAVRIASMAPAPLNLTTEQVIPTPQPAPEAAAAASSMSAAIAARADQRARRSRSIIGLTVDSFVAACSFIPYALVAIVLRLVMARLFFLDGQTRIEGPRIPLNVQDFDFSVVLPLQVKVETFGAFLTHYAALPVSPVLGAYLLCYAEFILPICLLLGFGTRFAALGLLIMTALIQVYVAPDALWSVHVYWAAILLVLLSRGPGPISVDAIIRFIARR